MAHPTVSLCFVRFEVFTAVTVNNVVFWYVGLVVTDVSEEHAATNLRIQRICDRFLRNVGSNKTHIPEDGMCQR
jgi:hypothetical protein